MIIYKTTNLINGKIYIGQDSYNNPKYLGGGVYFNRAIKKYGRNNFKKEILEQCETSKQLNEREEYWIKKLNSTNSKIGYNIIEKAFGIYKGYKHTLESNEKLSNSLKGKPKSEEHKRNLSLSTLGKPKHTEESKQKLREFKTGFKYSEESKQKLSNSLSKLKKEQIKQIILKLKAFETQTCIAKDFGVTQSIISEIKMNKSHYNFKFNLFY